MDSLFLFVHGVGACIQLTRTDSFFVEGTHQILFIAAERLEAALLLILATFLALLLRVLARLPRLD